MSRIVVSLTVWAVAALASVPVGAADVNLIRNAGFEEVDAGTTFAKGWEPTYWSNPHGKVTLSEAARTGERCLVVTGVPPDEITDATPRNNNLVTHRVDPPIKGVRKLVLQAWFKAAENARAYCSVMTHDADGNRLQYVSSGKFRHEISDPLLVEGTVHHFDIVRALSGADARTVYAVTWNPPWGEYAGDSNGLITMTMTNGVRVFYEGNKTSATTLNGWGQDYFRAECELAALELDNRRLRVMSDLSGERIIVEKPLAQQVAWTNAWLAEMFVNWLNGGAAPPNALDDNIQCCALLFAAIKSAHTGQIVDVQGFLEKNLKAVEPASGAF